MYNITMDEKWLMMWRNYTKEFLDMLIYKAKIPSEKAYNATLERPSTSFVSSFDNVLAILIITIQTSFV